MDGRRRADDHRDSLWWGGAVVRPRPEPATPSSMQRWSVRRVWTVHGTTATSRAAASSTVSGRVSRSLTCRCTASCPAASAWRSVASDRQPGRPTSAVRVPSCRGTVSRNARTSEASKEETVTSIGSRAACRPSSRSTRAVAVRGGAGFSSSTTGRPAAAASTHSTRASGVPASTAACRSRSHEVKPTSRPEPATRLRSGS